jgi:hypothetical protein
MARQHRSVNPDDINRLMQEHFPRDLHKEIWGFGNRRPDQTMYRWWWEFVRAYVDYADQYPVKSAKKRAARDATLAKFGELGRNFNEWWGRLGSQLFAEDGVPLITALLPSTVHDAFEEDETIIVSIPLNISRDLIVKQLRVALTKCHGGVEVERHAASSAKLKIYPRRIYPDTNYEDLLAIWVAKQEDNRRGGNKAWWEISCDAARDEQTRAELTPLDRYDRNRETAAADAAKAEARLQLGKQAEALYQQADVLMENAIIGEFPNDGKFQAKKRGIKKD